MLARDLMEPFPSVDVAADAGTAVDLVRRGGHPAVVVVDGGHPVTVLSASQLVRVLVPGYLQDDPHLVRVYDEKASAEYAHRLDGKVVKDLLPPRERRTELPVVDVDATLLECAAVLARLRAPLLAVSSEEEDGVLLGAITATRVLAALLEA